MRLREFAASVGHDTPHRQFVFTFPKMLRGIFRKRRHLLHLLFQTATKSLRDAFRARLGLPDGRIAAAAAVHTFGDYLVFHPHLHLFAADGLFDEEGRFHAMPDEALAPITELFRHRFLQSLRNGKHLSAQKVSELLAWKHSGFHIDGGEKPVASGDTKGRQRLAEPERSESISRARPILPPENSLEPENEDRLLPLAAQLAHEAKLRSLQSHRLPRRRHRSHSAARPPDDPLLRSVLEQEPRHATPIRRAHGIHRRKTDHTQAPDRPAAAQGHRPRHAPPKARPHPPRLGRRPTPVPVLQSHHASRGHLLPRWRNRKTPKAWRRFGQESAQRMTCLAGVKGRGAALNQFFLRLHGLWEGVIDIPPPPDPPFDIDTFEPIEPPWQAICEWIPDDDAEPGGDLFDQRPDSGKPVEIPREDGTTLVLDGD